MHSSLMHFAVVYCTEYLSHTTARDCLPLFTSGVKLKVVRVVQVVNAPKLQDESRFSKCPSVATMISARKGRNWCSVC